MNFKFMKVRSIFIIIAALVLLSSCNRFNDGILKDQFSESSNLELAQFNGDFELSPHRILDKNGNLSLFIGLQDFENIFDIIQDESLNLVEPSLRNLTTMKLIMIDEKMLAIALHNNGKEIYYEEVSGELKKDGFFYLDLKHESYLGLPYIFGGLYKYQSRIGISRFGSLLLQTAELNQGSFMFFLQKGYKRHRVYHFRRISEDIRA